jgi:hypothetical protein
MSTGTPPPKLLHWLLFAHLQMSLPVRLLTSTLAVSPMLRCACMLLPALSLHAKCTCAAPLSPRPSSAHAVEQPCGRGESSPRRKRAVRLRCSRKIAALMPPHIGMRLRADDNRLGCELGLRPALERQPLAQSEHKVVEQQCRGRAGMPTSQHVCQAGHARGGRGAAAHDCAGHTALRRAPGGRRVQGKHKLRCVCEPCGARQQQVTVQAQQAQARRRRRARLCLGCCGLCEHVPSIVNIIDLMLYMHVQAPNETCEDWC